MAKYTITHTCGHTSEAQLFGPHADRERELSRKSAELCAVCRAEAALAADHEAGLPALTGSNAQIAWASSIRQAALATLAARTAAAEATLASCSPAQQANWARVQVEFAALRQQCSAAWWIEHRTDDFVAACIAAAKAKAGAK